MFKGMKEKIVSHFMREVSSPKCKILTKISPDPLLSVRRRPTERSRHFHTNSHFPAHVGQSLALLKPPPPSIWLIPAHSPPHKEAAEVWVGSNTILPQGGAKRSQIKNHVEVQEEETEAGESPCWRHPLWHRRHPWLLAPPTASASSPLLCLTSSATEKGKAG